MTLLDSALLCARHGWPVIPCPAVVATAARLVAKGGEQ
jgi:hypothetical protein